MKARYHVFIVLAAISAQLVWTIQTIPMYSAAKRGLTREDVDDVAMATFQEGRFDEACRDYERAAGTLEHDLYATFHATEFLLYCGHPSSALRTALSFNGNPFWYSGELDPEHLARVRLFTGQLEKAEALTRGRVSYLRYQILRQQERAAEADQVLLAIAGKDGLAAALLARHRGQPDALSQASALCSNFRSHRPATPAWLERVFESCMLSEGASGATSNRHFASAVRAMPGMRSSLSRFVRSEIPSQQNQMESSIQATIEER